ncbi:hypothetical protein GOP47_0008142 [Adiantum capillus-veneris]|uniref:Uncharacterized protein n=1 Tax=Adiantum capillus-veneris TaxID=13818 RepID=A0A9D4UZ48_ADICA|nr:hypothetical protein GOP47_0008142 [Adiantum capillus-veneris]
MESSPHENADTQHFEEQTFEEDATMERLQEILLQMWHQLRGDTVEDSTTLRTFITNSIENIKTMISDFQINVTDFQISQLEEKVHSIRREVASLKIQLNRLNAIVTHFNNMSSRIRR